VTVRHGGGDPPLLDLGPQRSDGDSPEVTEMVYVDPLNAVQKRIVKETG
jgi:hypothetical protein